MEEILKVFINNKIDEKIGEITLSTHEETNGEEMAFTSLSKHKNGDIVKVEDKGVRFLGMIVRLSDGGKPPYSYTAQDFSRNLGSDTIKQFNGVNAKEALKQLFAEYKINAEICEMPTKIKKIYKDTILGVVKDILKIAGKEQGKSYYLEVRGTKVIIEEKKKRKIKADFIISDEMAIEKSIEELRNKIAIVGEGEKLLAVRSDLNSQKKFGIMQHNEDVSGKVTKAKAGVQADNLLKKLNKEKKSVSLTLIVKKGYWNIRKNRLIYINTKKIKGWFCVRSASHAIAGGRHTVSIELEW